MLIRLIGGWFLVAILALAAMAAMDRHQRLATDRHLLDIATKVVALDWVRDFDATLEPTRPVDTMPGLHPLIDPLFDPRLDVRAVGLMSPSGQLVATRGSGALLKRLSGRTALEAGNSARAGSALRTPSWPPQPVLAVDGATRLLWLPLRDWTGLTRGVLALAYSGAEFEPAPSPWPVPEFLGAVGSGAVLLFLMDRHQWRSIGATERKWLPAGFLAGLLVASGIVGIVRTAEVESRSVDRVLSGIAERLSIQPVRWNARLMLASPVSLAERLKPILDQVPDFVVSSRAELHDTRLRIGKAAVVTLTAADGSWRTWIWRALLRDALLTLIACLALAQCMPAILPRRFARRREISPEPSKRLLSRPRLGSRESACASLFLIACAIAGSWPAFIASPETGFAAPLEAALLVTIATGSALVGAVMGCRVAERRGWRFAALPGALCGVVGAIGLSILSWPESTCACWTVLGFGSGLAAVAVLNLAPRRHDGRRRPNLEAASALACLSGSLAGLAFGAVAVAMAGRYGALAPSTALWVCALLAVALRRNDATAALRYAVTRLELPSGVVRPRFHAASTLRGVPLLAASIGSLGYLQWWLVRVVPALDLGMRSAHALRVGLNF